jgi:cyanate permease
MALGFMLGTLISATVLSPALGGWRNVLLFYGGLALLLSIPWALVRSAPRVFDPASGAPAQASMRQGLAHVARIRQLWLLGWAIFGVGGAVQGLLGYLPLYLRDMGWPPATADTAASTFHLVSMICVVPIALLSDRRGTRRNVLIGAALMIATGIGLLSVAQGVMVWVAICLAGMVRDGFMAVFITMIMETEGVGPVFAGTATGLVFVFSGLGGLVAPSVGNSLAAISPSLPFVFWSALAASGILGLLATREKSRSPAVISPAPAAR